MKGEDESRFQYSIFFIVYSFVYVEVLIWTVSIMT